MDVIPKVTPLDIQKFTTDKLRTWFQVCNIHTLLLGRAPDQQLDYVTVHMNDATRSWFDSSNFSSWQEFANKLEAEANTQVFIYKNLQQLFDRKKQPAELYVTYFYDMNK